MEMKLFETMSELFGLDIEDDSTTAEDLIDTNKKPTSGYLFLHSPPSFDFLYATIPLQN